MAKAGWYFDVVTPEIPHHLAKGGILTAHGGHVVGADVFEPANVASGHPSSVATYQDPPTSALRIDPTSSSPKASCERTAGPYMRMRSRDRPGLSSWHARQKPSNSLCSRCRLGFPNSSGRYLSRSFASRKLGSV